MASIFSESWTNIIFQDRNQEYGAYELRRNSARNALIAGGASVLIFVTAIAAPFIINAIGGALETEKVKVVEVTTLAAPPPIDPNEPPPPPVEPPPPLKTTIKFTPPVVVPDEEVTEEDEPPPQDAFEEADAGAVTEQGDSSGVDMSLLEVTGNDVIDEDANKVFTVVEQMPVFPGGDLGLQKWIAEHTVYPAIAKENDIEGTVYVQFVVDKQGNVGGVKIARGVDKYLDKEAVRVVSALPGWKPGRQNGKEVQVQYTVPIRFKLN